MSNRTPRAQLISPRTKSNSLPKRPAVSDPLKPDELIRFELIFARESSPAENGIKYVKLEKLLGMLRAVGINVPEGKRTSGLILLINTDSGDEMELKDCVEFASYFMKSPDGAYCRAYVEEAEVEYVKPSGEDSHDSLVYLSHTLKELEGTRKTMRKLLKSLADEVMR